MRPAFGIKRREAQGLRLGKQVAPVEIARDLSG